ncbi:MAG: rRNA maturation RNase YbeY [Solirubrobacteraceae bacterium]
MIRFFSENNFKKYENRKLSTWIKKTVLEEKKKAGDINIIFCDDDYLLEVNKKYLNHNYFTDVITFDYSENKMVSGDIYISTDTVLKNATDYKVEFYEELKRIIIHGTLHLLGYKDKTKKEISTIRAKEDYYLSLFNN